MKTARTLYIVWLAALLALYALHFPHLLADFPNNSPWMDYSKYTDEGWYGSAAVRYWLTGHWFFRGDFNPAVALPVWPLLLAGLFRFTGVSLTAARALNLGVFGANLLLVYAVLRAAGAPRWTALLADTVLLANAFLWAFSRLAILEPLLICFLLLTWLLALRMPSRSGPAETLSLGLIGLLLCLTVLTKTTAVFLLPSTIFLVVQMQGYRWRSVLRSVGIVAAGGVIPWCAWYFLLVRPHYRADYQYFFDANKWPQPTDAWGWVMAFWYALHGAVWISSSLCIAAAALLALTLRPARRVQQGLSESSASFWRNPLVTASLLAAAGYIFFTGWHNNPQPRYYETVIYSLALLLGLGTADLLRTGRAPILRLCGFASLIAIAAASVIGTVQIARFVIHPEYTFLNAAQALTRYIDEHPAPTRLLLSISGADLSLMTHIPSICDDYGTWDLPYRVHTYQPAWYAAWNDLDPGTLEDLHTQDSLERVAAFSAFDDPDRNLLVLYRLHPLPRAEQTYQPREEEAANRDK